VWSNVKIWAPKLALAAAAAFLLLRLVIAAGILLEHNWAAVRFPYPLDYGEGPILDQAVRMARLQNIYGRALAEPPYTIANYPPLYPLLQVPFVWAAGRALWYGRAISALSILAAALFCGLSLHAITGDRLSALVGGLMLLTFPYIVQWPFVDQLYRQEFPAILLYDPSGWDSQEARWTVEMRAMIAMRYERVDRLAGTVVLRPRTR